MRRHHQAARWAVSSLFNVYFMALLFGIMVELGVLIVENKDDQQGWFRAFHWVYFLYASNLLLMGRYVFLNSLGNPANLIIL